MLCMPLAFGLDTLVVSDLRAPIPPPPPHHPDKTVLTEFAAVFPGLVESVDAKDYNNAVRWAEIIETCIKTATANIKVGHHG